MPIAAHMLNNALALGMALSQLSHENKTYTLREFQKNWWVGPVCLTAGALLLGYLTRGSWDLRSWRLPDVPRLSADPSTDSPTAI